MTVTDFIIAEKDRTRTKYNTLPANYASSMPLLEQVDGDTIPNFY